MSSLMSLISMRPKRRRTAWLIRMLMARRAKEELSLGSQHSQQSTRRIRSLATSPWREVAATRRRSRLS